MGKIEPSVSNPFVNVRNDLPYFLPFGRTFLCL